MKRNRSSPHSFEGRILAEKQRLEECLLKTPDGPQREAVLDKIRQLDTAKHMSEWLLPPGSKSPM
jgi:hypothetical protein